MNLQEAIKLLKDNDYEVKPMNEGIGDWVKRTLGNDTLLNQKVYKVLFYCLPLLLLRVLRFQGGFV